MGISYDTGQQGAPFTPGGVARIGGVQPPNLVNLPPELYPPDQATGFVLFDSQPVVGLGSNTTFPNFALTLPFDQAGVINALTISIDGILISTAVTFALIINGAGVQGYNQLQILPRNGAAFVSLTFGPQLRILVPPGGAVQAIGNNVDGASYTLGIQAQGWFWPALRATS